MKTKFATALSLVGVLGAGSAAALVNTQILDSGPADADASSVLTPSPSVTIPADTSTTLATMTQPSTTVTTTLPATPASSSPIVVTVPTAAQTPTGFLTSYNVGDAGVVTVDVVNGSVVLVSATPNPGWTVTKAENDSVENRVEATFAAGTTLVEFEVVFVDGQLVPRVESKSTATSPANTTATTTTSNTIDDDDDDDDDHEDDDGDDHEDDDGDDHEDDDGDDHEDDDGDDHEDDDD